MNRRQSLKLLIGAGCCYALPAHTKQLSQYFIACRNDAQQRHFVSKFTADGEIVWNVSLPGRGHAITVAPGGKHAIVAARSPGQFMWILDHKNHQLVHKLQAPDGRHFYGHAVFSKDQRTLFTTENDYHAAQGIIGVYDARSNYKRIAELPSHGVGPHQLLLLNDGKTLVIANGGIETHPDYPRMKLNLDRMRSNLAYVDSQSGTLHDKYELPEKWHQLSIRHIDLNADDQIAIAMQHQGAQSEMPPLVALHRGENQLQLLHAPAKQQRRMKNYCGSVAYAHNGHYFSVSSPRGNLISHWGSSGEYLGESEQGDACGLAADKYNKMWVSDGGGHLVAYHQNNRLSSTASFSGTRWDNHLTAIESA